MELTERKANIIGFNPEFANRKDCRIGTFMTVTKTQDGRNVVLVYHEGVQNKDCSTSLLSEFQMWEYGCIVDSTASTHLRADG